MAKIKASQLSIQMLKTRGYDVDIAERYNSITRQKNDLFGFVDLVAIGNTLATQGDILFVQTTSYAHAATRQKKMLEIPLLTWIHLAGIKVLVHGWRKRAKPGEKVEKLWCRELRFTGTDFEITSNYIDRQGRGQADGNNE